MAVAIRTEISWVAEEGRLNSGLRRLAKKIQTACAPRPLGGRSSMTPWLGRMDLKNGWVARSRDHLSDRDGDLTPSRSRDRRKHASLHH